MYYKKLLTFIYNSNKTEYIVVYIKCVQGQKWLEVKVMVAAQMNKVFRVDNIDYVYWRLDN